MSYIHGIDGLRALAVLSVFLYHLSPSLIPAGFIGVDIFFVISGYVVSLSIYKSTATTGKWQSLVKFYSRRFVRIFPALFLCLVVTSIVSVLIVPLIPTAQTVKYTGVSAFFGFSNFVLYWFNDGYFSTRTELNPFTHTWSLAVEEQFYLVYPLLLISVIGLTKIGDFSKTKKVFWLYVLVLISFVICIYESIYYPVRSYYLLPSRFWELGVGGILLVLHLKKRFIPSTSTQRTTCTMVGLILIVVSLFMAGERNFPFPWAVPPVAGCALILCGFQYNESSSTRWVDRIFEMHFMTAMGKISYSLYLWHWPIIVFFKWTVGMDGFLKTAFAALFSLICAFLSYKYVERKISFSRVGVNYNDRSIVRFSLSGMVIGSLITGVLFLCGPYLSLSKTSDRAVWSPYTKANFIEKKSEEKTERLYVVGDSHAAAYSRMLHEFEVRNGYRVTTVSKRGCGIANMVIPVLSENSRCTPSILNKIENVTSTIREGDVVFLAALRMRRYGESPSSVNHVETAFSEAVDYVKKLEKKGVKVLIDLPKPVFQTIAGRCSDWFNYRNKACEAGFSIPTAELLERRDDVVRRLHALKSMSPNVYLWDPLEVLCGASECSSVDDNGKPLFFDYDHLTGYGNDILYESFENRITPLFQN